jgi:abortive infection bacteriophage resistance protein
MSYKKPKTHIEQIELLKARGLAISNTDNAIKILKNNSYYRLSGYWHNFQIDPKNDNNNFKNGASLNQVYELHQIDNELRNLLMDGLTTFEISFRSKLAYCIAHSNNNPYEYLQNNAYDLIHISKNEDPDFLLNKIFEEINRSQDLCIKHFRANKERTPIWAAVEVLSFGTISKMYSRWNNTKVKKQIKSEYDFNDYEKLSSVVRATVILRNLVAHHSRIWNRKTSIIIPKNDLYKKYGNANVRSMWRIITMLAELVDFVNGNKIYSNKVIKLCKSNKMFFDGLIHPTL